MKDKITVIITIRNRDPWRIEKQVKSIRDTGANPSFHVVDYGSTSEYRDQYEELCKELEIQYTHLYAEGLPWNKCRAINYGARQAQTPFIVTSDVDVIYDGNAFQWCLDNYKDKHFYQIESFWLPKSNKKSKSKSAGHGSPGLFCFTHKSAFEEVGGYDERYEYWGLEDLDWPERLKKVGYNQIWLPTEFKIFHMWHISMSDSIYRPYTASQNSIRFSVENLIQPILNQEYGKSLRIEERPILKFIEEKEYKTISFRDKSFSFWGNWAELLSEKFNGCYKIIIGNRIKKRPLQIFRKQTKFLLKPCTALTSNRIETNVNISFDYFYECIPLLKKIGLCDYYFSDDVSYIFLLFKSGDQSF